MRAIASDAHRRAALVPLVAGALACSSAACSRAVAPLVTPGQSAVALTGGPNTSMIYLARTSAGVVAIDLGWWGYRHALSRALRTLAATPGDVRFVFLTHSHRDHVAAWRSVRHARFYLAEPDLSSLTVSARHKGWIPRWADKLKPTPLPGPPDLDLRTFTRDTTFLFGHDTLHAYLVPGHTPGSVVYLFRGVLFVGDAMTYSRRTGFATAKRGFSDDPERGASSLADLWRRLPAGGVDYLCTAHARCARFTPELAEHNAR